MYEATRRRKTMSEERGVRAREQRGGIPKMESKANNYEPLANALQELIEPEGWWIGDEGRLIEELRTRVGDETSVSGGFPTSLEELEEHLRDVSDAPTKVNLYIDDYRSLSWEHIDAFDAPGWSEESPILVYRMDRVLPNDYHNDLGKVLERWDPFPLSLFLFALNEELGNGRSWQGTTPELAAAMRQYHGDYTEVPEWFSEIYQPSWAADPLPVYETAQEYASLMWPASEEDYEAFAKRMMESVSVLEEAHIRVRAEEYPSETKSPKDPVTGDENWEQVRWEVRAPLWFRSEYL
jgi:hypothetical protein